MSNKLTVLQQLTIILSALSSLFSFCILIFQVLEHFVFKDRSGHISLHPDTGVPFVRPDKNVVLPSGGGDGQGKLGLGDAASLYVKEEGAVLVSSRARPLASLSRSAE